jgi:hypothetical protein
MLAPLSPPAGTTHSLNGRQLLVTQSTAAISWTPGKNLRVYSCEGANVTEKCYDGTAWTVGAFEQPGQFVSATCTFDDNLIIWVFVTNNGTTTEHYSINEGPWQPGGYPG